MTPLTTLLCVLKTDSIGAARFQFGRREITVNNNNNRDNHMSNLLCNVLTGILVLVHSALVLIDIVGVVNLADFMIRPDGSQQDPNAMLPVEKVLVTMIAFPFGIVALAFLLAPRKCAALIAAATHAAYLWHQWVHYDTWLALFHPDTDLSMEFFMYPKLGWTVISLWIWYLSKDEATTIATTTSADRDRSNKESSKHD